MFWNNCALSYATLTAAAFSAYYRNIAVSGMGIVTGYVKVRAAQVWNRTGPKANSSPADLKACEKAQSQRSAPFAKENRGRVGNLTGGVTPGRIRPCRSSCASSIRGEVELMNGRQIIRAVLQGQATERVPWVPCIDPYTRSGLPEPLGSMDLFELQRYFGSDLYRGGWASSERFDSAIRHTHSEPGNGVVVDAYETPGGSIREAHTFVPESPYIPFPTEYLIKSWADLDAYLCLLEHTMVEPDHQRLGELINAYPQAMITTAVTDTPLPALMTKLIGTENFVFMHSDDPARIRRAMDAMQALHRRRVEAAAQGPAEVCICYENTNTSSFGVRWIEEYELPWLNEYAEILHAAGKKLLVHMCGHIRLVIEQIAAARFDGIIDVAPPPTGDCDVAAAAAALNEHGKTLGGGISCTTFILQDADRFEREVRELMENVAANPRFMLGSGDAVPKGATGENLLRAGAIARACRLR